MNIIKNADQPSAAGPAETFTGRVRVDGLFSAPDPARAGAAIVTFEPGARTAWHSHPAGQLLFILSGLGWVQRDGGEKARVVAGDTVWFAPGEKHWHGASAGKAMSHVAIAEKVDGRSTDWMEHVSDADYEA
ncbi:(R)-mandelonitrile lyase [Acuticoccus kandeliae]|uniref:(R)-mandelonitrile lyase n=1 Tax=Acuticoccus kandeliae TaxID=2073160 RepID=UPI000D3E9F60|nr:cupin domain-containing protein [Acuticoccus kandeliae]